MFYVRGNHDEAYDSEPPGGINLHRQVVEYGGLVMAGLEGSIKYNRGHDPVHAVADASHGAGPGAADHYGIAGRGNEALISSSPTRRR